MFVHGKYVFDDVKFKLNKKQNIFIETDLNGTVVSN